MLAIIVLQWLDRKSLESDTLALFASLYGEV